MKNETLAIKKIEHFTHDVLHIVVEKPKAINFHSGQATEVFIDKEGWRNEGRPFTFICLPEDNYLEFAIKTYPDHKGVTNELLSLKEGDNLILNDVFGAIEYKGPGTFIAGGAGVTPFISIIRNLAANNKIGDSKLIFANKTADDIILEEEFSKLLKDNFINILSKEENAQYHHGMISEDFIKKHALSLQDYFYVCGPPPMMEAVLEQLSKLGIKKDKIITEEF